MTTIFTTPVLSPLLRALARLGLKLGRWKLDIVPPIAPPYVFIGAPHTSNWDFLLMLATALALKMDVRWLGKDSLFRFPFRPLMLWLGGIPTDRSKPGRQVARAAQLLREQPQLVLCVAPEGTRSSVRRWKSGFYHIAREAGVPIMLTLLDAPARTVRLLGVHEPGEDAEREIAELQQRYHGHRGLNPANASDFSE